MAQARRFYMMTFEIDDFVPVTCGSDLRSNYLRSGTCALQDLKVTTDIDRHLVRLLTLHPDLQVAFRCQDLGSLDDSTKRDLLCDISDLLGIKSLRK